LTRGGRRALLLTRGGSRAMPIHQFTNSRIHQLEQDRL
jgi:hypothetical protein